MTAAENFFLPRGKTMGAAALADSDAYEGAEHTFNSEDFPQSKPKVKAVLVRNISGGALLPGTVVKRSFTNSRGTQVAQAGALDIGCGVVDSKLPAAGVANNDLFWMIVAGPEQVVAKTGTTIAAGDTVVTDASGTIVTIPSTPASATAAQQDALAYIGQAITGVTTAAAGAKIWVQLSGHV